VASFLQRLFGRTEASEIAPPPAAPLDAEDRKALATVDCEADRSDYTYSTSGAAPTPARIASAIRRADDGEIGPLSEIVSQILERDWQAAAVVNTRTLAVLGLRREVSDTEDPEIADAVRDMLDGLGWRGDPEALDFGGVLSALLGAIVHPLSACEIVWTINGGRAEIAGVYHRPTKRFRYNTGNMASGELGDLRLVSPADTVGQPLRPGKWIVHRSASGYTMRHRAGIGRLLLWSHLFKTIIFRDWVVYMEVYGQPLRIGRYSPASTTADRQALRQALASLGTDAAAILSDQTNIEFQEANRGDSGDSYAAFVEYIDRQIARAVLGHEGSSSSTSGRLGGEDEAAAVRQDILEADAAALADIVTRQLIAPFVRFNFGPDAEIPMLRLVSEESEDLDKLADRVKVLAVDAGLPIPVAWVYDRFGIPAPEGDEPVLERPPSGGGGGMPFAEASHGQGCCGHAKTGTLFAAEDDDALDLIDRQEDAMVEQAVAKARPLHREVARPFVDGVERSSTYGQALDAVRQAQADTEALAALLADVQISANVIGAAQVLAETGLGEAAGTVRIWPAQEAIDWLAKRTPIDHAAYQALSSAQKTRAFSLARHEADGARQAVFDALNKALADGQSFGTFQRAYREIARSEEFMPTSSAHLETVYRNGVSRGLSVGRHQQMTTPAVVALRPYWQYRTVGDGSVRPEHQELNGLVYPADHPFWGTYGPPNGHRCRCRIVTLSQRQVDQRGLTVQTQIDDSLPRPPEGWDVAPWVDPGSEEGLQ